MYKRSREKSTTSLQIILLNPQGRIGDGNMIEVTKINGIKVLVNPALIELVEETPDTVLTLTTGKKIIVKESRQEIKNLVILYRKDIFAR